MIFLKRGLLPRIKRNTRLLFLLVIFYLFSYFFLTFKITDVPPGINGDEAAIGYSAALIVQTGYDSAGRFLPIFTKIPGSEDWKQPITLYSTVLVFKTFGESYFNLKLVSVVFALLSATIIFFLAKEIFSKRYAIISWLIFITMPVILIHSHLALENIAPVPFIAFWLWMMAKYTKTEKIKYLILAGIALGFSLYSYLGLRLIMPILTVLSVGYLYYLSYLKSGRKSNIYAVPIFIIVLLPFLISLLIFKNQYPGAVFAHNRPQNLTSYQQFFLPYISTFDLSFLFMKGDATPYHSTGKQGMFLLATLPIFILGILNIVREKRPILFLTLLVFILAPLLYGLPGQTYRASRLLTLCVPFVIICLSGLQGLLEIKIKKIKLLILFLTAILISLNFMDFVYDYWYQYPNRVKSEFAKPYQLVFEKARDLVKDKNLRPYIQSDFRMQNTTAIDFFEQIYFPERLTLWEDNQLPPEKSVIIISDPLLSKNQDKILENFGEFGLIVQE